ncbi:HNH endonuclease [Nocardia sp. NPDC057030]|uniref:HNH endonuclease n=1 Tax=unclassified Nocardia TaxID=2637762 RepID=UPI003645A612
MNARQSWPKIPPRRESKSPRHSRSGPATAVRRKVWARSGRCCERCGIGCNTFFRTAGEIHHRRNRSQGVDNSLANLVLLCHLCHVWVGADPKAAATQGFHLEQGDIPEKTPVLYGGEYTETYGRRWMVLSADGGVDPAPEDPPPPQEGNA